MGLLPRHIYSSTPPMNAESRHKIGRLGDPRITIPVSDWPVVWLQAAGKRPDNSKRMGPHSLSGATARTTVVLALAPGTDLKMGAISPQPRKGASWSICAEQGGLLPAFGHRPIPSCHCAPSAERHGVSRSDLRGRVAQVAHLRRVPAACWVSVGVGEGRFTKSPVGSYSGRPASTSLSCQAQQIAIYLRGKTERLGHDAADWAPAWRLCLDSESMRASLGAERAVGNDPQMRDP
ncbi:hypothetical protein B0T24DRAFT_620205 [Lasiosphaeria ovina]|uniref:Uncharacterized protein n=1 Tax=Lasiosphaeria ovina TaxID=92902 RepID=A0AAE0KIS0_9PEZI|nr:hypothetical protein B0T24DRAFT_620205 [Lasiosphaeria ovina]